ncbi:MAG: 50S ribosomal protein L18 [Alphaproteobacteria bacterium]|nr:50S ribosomal protein L18 [Alphaproteobacteria bacterium]
MIVCRDNFHRRRNRVRRRLLFVSSGRPRLSVHRSVKHIYAQLIDDKKGVTLASASTIEKVMRDKSKSGSNKEAAKQVGILIGERARKIGVEDVVFDRGGHVYHGCVKALADAAREEGLLF